MLSLELFERFFTGFQNSDSLLRQKGDSQIKIYAHVYEYYIHKNVQGGESHKMSPFPISDMH